MLILAVLNAIKKSPLTSGTFLFYTSFKRGVYWQASHSASSLGSIGQVIGLSQSSLLIELAVLAFSGICNPPFYFVCMYLILPKRK